MGETGCGKNSLDLVARAVLRVIPYNGWIVFHYMVTSNLFNQFFVDHCFGGLQFLMWQLQWQKFLTGM